MYIVSLTWVPRVLKGLATAAGKYFRGPPDAGERDPGQSTTGKPGQVSCLLSPGGVHLSSVFSVETSARPMPSCSP